jgi:MFS family permease
VDLSVFRRRSLTGGNVVATLASATFAPMFFLVSVYLQDAEGWSALRTGVAFLPMAAVLILTSGVLGPRLLPRVGVTTMAVGSLLLIAAGSALFAITLDPDRSYLLAVLPAMLMVATGMGLVFPAFMSAAVAGVPDRQQGLASGLVNTSQQVGAALGLAVLVSVAAAVAPTVSDDGGQALATGFRAAFAAAAALALLAAGAAAALLRERECAPAVAAGRSAHQVTPGCVPPRPDRPARPSTASRR